MSDLLYSPTSSTQMRNIGIISPSTDRLQSLQRQVPVVGDKALIDLVNGIQVSKDIIRYRKSRGFFGQIVDTLDGSNNQRRLLLDGNLLAGQEALSNWVLELSDSLRISQVALQVTQTSLLEARDAIRSQKQNLHQQKQAVSSLSENFDQLAQQVAIRLDEQEARIHKLEVRVAASEDLDRIITAWAAGQTYSQLNWVLQVALLAREAFSCAVATYELETGDKERYRQLLVNKILATSKELPKNFFALADLLEQAWRETKSSDRFPARELATGLLEVRSIPHQRLVNTPYLFALGTTLELATLPAEARPELPAQSAVALCRAQIASISRTTDVKEFITNVVEETANDCLAIMR